MRRRPPPLLLRINHRGDADEIAVIEVEASEQPHQNRKGETYLRVGDENRKLGVMEAQELQFDKGQSVFDGRPAPGRDISPKGLSVFIAAPAVGDVVRVTLAGASGEADEISSLARVARVERTDDGFVVGLEFI